MYQLPEELLINDINTLHKSIIKMLDEKEVIKLDISNVIQVDTASIQLLCALQKYLLLTDHKIQWNGKSEALHKSANTLGVLEFLAFEQSE
jgi:ABC-type transporter Mla MlaB component